MKPEIKIPEKSPIFAYLRRSTNKEEQAESLIQQEDGIGSIVKRLGFEKEDIVYFAETFSGFENKKRKQWGKLIEAIDKLKTPCTILTRDISRLSRNPTDSQGIMDRLYGDNKHKKRIEKIYSLDYDGIKTWDKTTDKEEVHRALSASYYDSLDTRRKSIGGILLKLEDRQFPYAAPKGLSSCKIGTRRILKQNEQMSLVRRAFEMKMEGKNHKDISKFLRDYAQIRIGERDLTDRLFRNVIYIGEYQEKTTGKHFSKLDFVEGRPPIDRALWNKAQSCLGRKISQYGEKQEGHLLEAKIRSESGHVFSKYMAKQRFPSYKGRFVDKDTDCKGQFIHISEIRIIQSFFSAIGGMVAGFTEKYPRFISDDIIEQGIKSVNKKNNYQFTDGCIADDRGLILPGVLEKFAQALDREAIVLSLLVAGREHYDKQPGGFQSAFRKEWEGLKTKRGAKPMTEMELSQKMLVDKGILVYAMEGKESGYDPKWGYDPMDDIDKEFRGSKQRTAFEMAAKKMAEILKRQFLENTKDFERAKENELKRLQKKKEEIETERKNYRREALKMGYSREEIEEVTKDMDDSIKSIDSQISEFSGTSDMGDYLDRLPEALLKTVELAGNTICGAKYDDMKDDIKKLIEITTVELTITNKKELRIQLFDVLDKLVSSDNFNLEVPSGVEPLSKALQASV